MRESLKEELVCQEGSRKTTTYERNGGHALFSFCLCDGIHLAGQRLSRSLVLGDEAREHPTIHQGYDLNLFVFQICNHMFSVVLHQVKHRVAVHAYMRVNTCAKLTLIKLRVTSYLVIKRCNNTSVSIEGSRSISQDSSNRTCPRSVSIRKRSRCGCTRNHRTWR